MDKKIVAIIVPIIAISILAFFYLRKPYKRVEITWENDCFVSYSFDESGYKKVFEKNASWRGKNIRIMYFVKGDENIIVYEVDLGNKKLYIGCKGKDIREVEEKVQNKFFEVMVKSAGKTS